MLVQGKFLISFDVQGIGFCEELIIAYRTEELTPYLRYPAVKLNPNHLHIYQTKQLLRELLRMPYTDIQIIDYYFDFLEEPETLYTFTENTINLLKSLIK